MTDPTTTPTPTEPHHDVRERAGRALYEHRQAAEFAPQDGYTAWDDLPEDWRDEYREAADAVLAAVSTAAPDERAEAQVAETLRERIAVIERSAANRGADLTVDEVVLYLRSCIQTDAHHIAAALAARPAPTVNAADVEITTAAELDALPAGTIVRDRFGGYLAQGRDAMGVAWFHYPVYDHAGSSALVAGIGPVTVCFTPGLTVADEGAER